MQTRHLGLATLFALLAACGSGSSTPAPADTSEAATQGDDAVDDAVDESTAEVPTEAGPDGLDAAPDPVAPDPVAPGGTATFHADFHVDAAGTGTHVLGGVSVVADDAHISLKGTAHVGIAYRRHDWTDAGYVLYDLVTLAVDGSDLGVTYLYCSGSTLAYAYAESFRFQMESETASGTCDGLATATDVTVTLPALQALPPPWTSGVQITGDTLSLDGAVGTITLAGAPYELRPFSGVDCTACPGGPWYEVHSLMVGEGRACFGILYLFPDKPGQIQLSYAMCVPDLATPVADGAWYSATWTGTLAPATTRDTPPWRPRPPG